MAGGNLTVTGLQRQFLRAVAAVNPHFRPHDPEAGQWWSPYDLQHTMLFTDFRLTSTMSLAALGRSCEAKGFIRTRRIGTRGHGWTEWRVTSLGRGLVSDSCIGGGLKWTYRDSILPRCPACRASTADLGLPLGTGYPPAEIPAHPLPGYLPAPVTATEETR